jgi:hypothetical protein
MLKDSVFIKNYLGHNETTSPFMTFFVTQSFKGEKKEMLQISQHLCMCTKTFKLNESYIIFGGLNSDGTIDTSMCSAFYFDTRTKQVKKILRQLNKVKGSFRLVVCAN